MKDQQLFYVSTWRYKMMSAVLRIVDQSFEQAERQAFGAFGAFGACCSKKVLIFIIKCSFLVLADQNQTISLVSINYYTHSYKNICKIFTYYYSACVIFFLL